VTKIFRVRTLPITLGLLTLLAVLAALPVHGQDELRRWTPAHLIGDGWWEYPAIDREGNLHVSWYDSKQNLDVMMYTRRSFSGEWTANQDIFCPCVTGFTVRNAMASTRDGILHAVFRAGDNQLFSSALALEAESAGSWHPPEQVGPNSYYVDMIADRDDNLHLVYAAGVLEPGSRFELDTCFYCTDVFYRNSTDGGFTWSEPLNLSNTHDGSERMVLNQGPSGRIYVAWTEGFDGWRTAGDPRDVRLRYTDDDGQNWSETIILDGGNLPNSRPSNLAVVELRDGRLLGVWRYSGADLNFYYQLSSDLGESWTDPEPIPGFVARSYSSNKYDHINLITDLVGTVHLFASGHPSADQSDPRSLALYHAQFAQDSWFGVERVYYRPERAPEWPKAVVGPQNDIHLVWFVRVLNPLLVQTGLEVYYSHLPGLLDSRPTEAFLPTREPPPTPTLFRNPDPTVTPVAHVPTLDPLTESGVLIASRDNYAAQTVIGGLGAALAFCVVAAVIARFFRR
jgi:hypothetical protein